MKTNEKRHFERQKYEWEDGRKMKMVRKQHFQTMQVIYWLCRLVDTTVCRLNGECYQMAGAPFCRPSEMLRYKNCKTFILFVFDFGHGVLISQEHRHSHTHTTRLAAHRTASKNEIEREILRLPKVHIIFQAISQAVVLLVHYYSSCCCCCCYFSATIWKPTKMTILADRSRKLCWFEWYENSLAHSPTHTQITTHSQIRIV